MRRSFPVLIIGEVKRIENDVETAIAHVSSRQIIQPGVSISELKSAALRTVLANSEVKDVLQYGKATWDKWSDVWMATVGKQLCMQRTSVSATSADGEDLKIAARIFVRTLGPVKAMVDEFKLQGKSPEEQRRVRNAGKTPRRRRKPINLRESSNVVDDYLEKKRGTSLLKEA